MSLGEQIKQLRVERGLNQPDLAEMAGIEQSYLSKLENGKSVPSNEIFRKLLQALEIELNQFMSRFDLVADRPHLIQVPDIEHWFKQREKKKVTSQRKYLYACSALIVLSTTLFYIGYSKQIFSETNYLYTSEGVLTPDDPDDFFKTWHITAKAQSREMPPEQAEKFYQEAEQHMKDKINYKHKWIPYRGETFTQDVDGGRRTFTASRQTKPTPRSINGWLQSLGIMLFTMGVTGFLMERRLYKL